VAIAGCRNRAVAARAIAAGGDGAAPPLLFRPPENPRLSGNVSAVELPKWTGAWQKGVTLTVGNDCESHSARILTRAVLGYTCARLERWLQ
jgi:hypothetical protein